MKVFFMIDDDPDDIEIFRETLEKSKAEAQLQFAVSAKEAIAKLQSANIKPTLIFLDIHMPDMNGWECLELIKKDQSLTDVPVIMYSVSDLLSDNKHALNAGALGLLTKPNDYKKLIKLLGQIAVAETATLKDFLQKKSIHFL